MSMLDDYRDLLFPNDESKKALIKAISEIKGQSVGDFDFAYRTLMHKVEDNNLQKILAPFLRSLAIRHLQFGNTDLAKGFRNEYEAVFANLDKREEGDIRSLDGFFRQQSQSYVYAKDIEAVALAEALGLTLAVTRVNEDLSAIEPARSYRVEPTPNAYTVHLFNLHNNHFFIHEKTYDSTIGDGNCLYNGFAQHLRQFVLYEDRNEHFVCAHQQKILDSISSSPFFTLQNLI